MSLPEKIFGLDVVENASMVEEVITKPISTGYLSDYRLVEKYTVSVKKIASGFSARCDQYPDMYVEAPTKEDLQLAVIAMFKQHFG